MAVFSAEKPCRILSLDGGGAKGFYTLGVLRELEGLLGTRLHEKFDLIFGTSTGAIIAALLSLGHSVDEIHQLYKEHVPRIMQKKTAHEKSAALAELSAEVFGDMMCDKIKTGIGIVTTRWVQETPMIFKASIDQAHGRIGTFVPFFGVPVGEAVQASCSAYPYPVPPDTPCRELSGNPPPLGRPIEIARRMGPGSGAGAPASNSKMTESNDN